ncbi:acyltransferase family protein [Thorsellia anophelis]|uniref:Surface polysaccharide O-acyltransferase, integral membrane enzyme n=1 Tax=Thorsellia anophelis DSM 18579 TaxID=1123402 RepID=A0A1H9ZNM7_9GAMM|nr:acyltransferase family protein [Thorsellia anophelis]SES83329.1 Surface polysaccharide O-acyltransferase, integral membrane enzyme [Thorsellia anophelis DSM 18579]
MRSVGLTVLKTISCFAAVTFYSTNQLCDEKCFLSTTTLGILYFLSIIATPLFFLVNGYADTERAKKGIDWQRVIAVVVIFTFWNIVGLFTFDHVAQNSYFLQSWLLISLASIYLLNPIFTKTLKNENLSLYALFAFVAVMLILDIVSLFRQKTFLGDIPDSFRVWTWYFYYFLGRFLALRKWRLLTKRKAIKRFAILSFLPIFILLYVYEKLIIKFIYKSFNAGYFLDSVFVIAATLCVFVIFDNINIQTKIIKKAFHYIAPTMIGVYILHDAVFYYINKIYPAHNVGLALLYLFTVFILSVLIVRFIMLNRWTAKLISI